MSSPSAATLMKQAPMTAKEYLIHARNDIDELFGDGYAANHPELMAAYMNAAAIDFLTTFGLHLGIGERLDAIASTLNK